jgi:hypothetical protein
MRTDSSVMRNKHATAARVFSLLSVLVFTSALALLRSSAQAPARNNGLVELTKTDLFSLPDWEKKTITVEGFALGISRTDAFRIADAANLILVPQRPEIIQKSPSPCVQESCDVYGRNSPWLGLSLSFDATQRVNKIAVGTSIDEIPEAKRVSVIRLFTGRTAQFFNDYSDAIREQLFGYAEGKATHGIPSGKEEYIEYDYPKSGVIVHITVFPGDSKPADIELDFLARQ